MYIPLITIPNYSRYVFLIAVHKSSTYVSPIAGKIFWIIKKLNSKKNRDNIADQVIKSAAVKSRNLYIVLIPLKILLSVLLAINRVP